MAAITHCPSAAEPFDTCVRVRGGVSLGVQAVGHGPAAAPTDGTAFAEALGGALATGEVLEEDDDTANTDLPVLDGSSLVPPMVTLTPVALPRDALPPDTLPPNGLPADARDSPPQGVGEPDGDLLGAALWAGEVSRSSMERATDRAGDIVLDQAPTVVRAGGLTGEASTSDGAEGEPSRRASGERLTSRRHPQAAREASPVSADARAGEVIDVHPVATARDDTGATVDPAADTAVGTSVGTVSDVPTTDRLASETARTATPSTATEPRATTLVGGEARRPGLAAIGAQEVPETVARLGDVTTHPGSAFDVTRAARDAAVAAPWSASVVAEPTTNQGLSVQSVSVQTVPQNVSIQGVSLRAVSIQIAEERPLSANGAGSGSFDGTVTSRAEMADHPAFEPAAEPASELASELAELASEPASEQTLLGGEATRAKDVTGTAGLHPNEVGSNTHAHDVAAGETGSKAAVAATLAAAHAGGSTDSSAVGWTSAGRPSMTVQPPASDEVVVPQLLRAIRLQARDGVGEARLQLEPDHLGAVTIALRIEHGTVSAVITAERAAVRQWIETHEHGLRDGLAQHGLGLGSLRVEADGERRSSEDPRRNAWPTLRRVRRETATFELVA